MPNLTRTTTRSASPRTRLLVVRQPVRSVQKEQPQDRLPLRLAIGIIIALGTLAVVWLMGHLGYRLGFAPLARVPELAGEGGRGLSTGTLMLIYGPRVIFVAAMTQLLWLMAGFFMIAIPAGGLAAARPFTPGGPKLKTAVSAIAISGAVAAILNGGLLLWWTSSALRNSMVSMLPLDPAEAEAWYTELQAVAGLDILAVVTAALWVVLVFRLPIPLWLRAIALSASFFTLVVVTVAMSISNAAAAQVGANRSLCILDSAGNQPRIILGSTPHHLATLSIHRGEAMVELRNHPDAIAVVGRQSVVGYLASYAPERE